MLNYKADKSRFNPVFITLFLIGLLISSNTVMAVTTLHIESDTNDYIGQGQIYDFDESQFTIPRFTGTNGNFSFRTNDFWFYFSIPGASLIEKGVYKNVSIWPVNSPKVPGLSISTTSRGCSHITGEFIVHEVSYNSFSQLDKLAIDFIQYCDSDTDALKASLRFNSEIPLVPTSPVAWTGSDLFARAGEIVSLDASFSFAGSVPITNYQWSHLSGPAVILSNTDSALTNVTLPDVALGGEDVVLQLVVTNGNLETDTSEITIKTASKSDPVTYFSFVSDSGEYIGQGLTRYWDRNDANFIPTNFEPYKNIIFSVRADSAWSLDFASPVNQQFTSGIYKNVVEWPFQTETVAGLSISGDSRGCSLDRGSFEIVDYSVAADNKIKSFAANFIQYCTAGEPRLSGEIRYNYVPAYVPRAYAGDNATYEEGATVVLDGSNSIDSDGSIISYKWTQTSGVDVQLTNTEAMRLSFVAPPLTNDASLELSFDLLVEDDDGYQHIDTIIVEVVAKVDAEVTNDTEMDSGATAQGGSSGGTISLMFLILLITPLVILRMKET